MHSEEGKARIIHGKDEDEKVSFDGVTVVGWWEGGMHAFHGQSDDSSKFLEVWMDADVETDGGITTFVCSGNGRLFFNTPLTQRGRRITMPSKWGK